MARSTKTPAKKSAKSTATIGFEAKLWQTVDKLRNNMDAAEYKRVGLGLIFPKYISHTFTARRATLVRGKATTQERRVKEKRRNVGPRSWRMMMCAGV